MRTFEWHEDLETNVPELDRQHRFLLNLVKQYDSATSLTSKGRSSPMW